MCQSILKEVYGDHKYLTCTYLQDKNFEVLYTSISLDKL